VGQLVTSLGHGWECVNGDHINYIREFDPAGLEALVWMPNVSNDEEKILDNLKVKNPHMLLVQSKRVIEKDYSPSDIVGRLLKSHAMLGIMISKEGNYRFRVLDPLGNLWVDTADISDVGHTIRNRLDYLASLTRIGSKQIVLPINASWGNDGTFPPEEFIEIVRQYGDEFTKFVNAINPNRLLGNASTRCASGFPAMRLSRFILVTRRNVDKTTLTAKDFVLVDSSTTQVVNFFGDNKPSVDTPIQLRLFAHYSNVNYIVHGHVYVEDGVFTKTKIPCGYVEEFDEIASLVDRNSVNFSINLRGHGCLILAGDLDYLSRSINRLYGRPFPES
jgi:hypothetical protein